MTITTPVHPDGRKDRWVDRWVDRRVDVQIDGRKAGKDGSGAFVIVLANHKGGVTKTTSTANLAAMLAEAGRRVLIVDCDPQANLSEGFGWYADIPGERLEDLLENPDAADRYAPPLALPATDRWQPLWGSPDGVAARAVEAIKQSEPYYYDVLRRHLDVVCKVLHAAGMWPPSIRLLIDACLPGNYEQLVKLTEPLDDSHAGLKRRARAHGTYVRSARGVQDLSGGVFRLEVALALAGRTLVTPRVVPDGETVAVRLVEALRQRPVVMWRTHADRMPDEAAALSVLALADLHDAAEQAGAPWTLLLDEFGAVIKMAAQRGVAILQRGRSHGRQVIVITQSAADIDALTQQPGLLASLTDNFAGVVAHRQTSPESRDWLAKLMGTRSLWQMTSQTGAHGHTHTGRGSARRVREFRISSDTFGALNRGEAVIYTPIAGEPVRASILPVHLPRAEPERIDPAGPRTCCEVPVYPEQTLPTTRSPDGTPIAQRTGPGKSA